MKIKIFNGLTSIIVILLFCIACKKEITSSKHTMRLEALFTEAAEVSSGVEEGPEPGLYPVGSVDQLNFAVDSAKRLMHSSVTQFGVDLAEHYLRKEIDQFKGSVQQEKQLYFSGAGYLDGGSAVPYLVEHLTLEAWVYPTEWKNAMYVISTEGDKNGYKLQCPNGKPTFQIGNGTSTTNIAAPNAINLNEWTHIAATYDGTTMKVYVNGSEVASKNVVTTIASNNENFRIGEGSRFTNRTFKGRMRDVRVWEHALSDTEIAASQTNKLTGTEAGLIANWPFNLSAGSTIFDRTGEHSLTLINMEYVDPI